MNNHRKQLKNNFSKSRRTGKTVIHDKQEEMNITEKQYEKILDIQGVDYDKESKWFTTSLERINELLKATTPLDDLNKRVDFFEFKNDEDKAVKSSLNLLVLKENVIGFKLYTDNLEQLKEIMSIHLKSQTGNVCTIPLVSHSFNESISTDSSSNRFIYWEIFKVFNYSLFMPIPFKTDTLNKEEVAELNFKLLPNTELYIEFFKS